MKPRVWICPNCSTPVGEANAAGFVRYEQLHMVGEQDESLNTECGVCHTRLTLKLERASIRSTP
jgi:hypothetical protein